MRVRLDERLAEEAVRILWRLDDGEGDAHDERAHDDRCRSARVRGVLHAIVQVQCHVDAAPVEAGVALAQVGEATEQDLAGDLLRWRRVINEQDTAVLEPLVGPERRPS